MKQIIRSIVDTSVKALPFKKQLFSTIKPIHPPQKIWGHLRFNGPFEVSLDGRHSFHLNNYGYGLETSIFWRGLLKGFGEEQALKLWMKLCGEARTIFDVGANMGIYSLVAKTINPDAQVYGFEPVAHLFEKLVENCKVNNYQVVCVHAALSDVDGATEIYIQPGGFATASLNPHKLRTESERVETKTIATFIENEHLQKLDLIKIDVEGFEPQVLKGMDHYLSTMKPTMIVEILTEDIGTQVEKIVKGAGYLFFNIDEIKGPLLQDSLTIAGKTRHSRNFLLCQESVATRLKLT